MLELFYRVLTPPPLSPQRQFLNIHEMHTVNGTSVTFIAERVNELPNVSQNTGTSAIRTRLIFFFGGGGLELPEIVRVGCTYAYYDCNKYLKRIST